ncbi:MAG: ribosome biogenesis GTPase YlqF [Sporomusaceae bacterium]|nr:ribosome biogenesis GTPase YlqF [Sporomusaceae bacterium]
MPQQHIHWFPGHMAKARRVIGEHLKLVDVVVELVDARIPVSSSNPMIDEIAAGKPRIIALNKADLAEPQWTKRWIGYYAAAGFTAVALEAASGKGLKPLTALIENAAAPVLARLAAKGIRPRPVRAMILGIPNVGKSSLINRLLGTATVRTGDRPGVTRGQQWIKIGRNLELLDTPGVLWPKMDDQEVAFKLAVTGAVPDEVYDREQVVNKLLTLLRSYYGSMLTERYQLPLLDADNAVLLADIGRRRGCLRGGGGVDFDKAGRILLTEFRSSKLGRVTLDQPAEGNTE